MTIMTTVCFRRETLCCVGVILVCSLLIVSYMTSYSNLRNENAKYNERQEIDFSYLLPSDDAIVDELTSFYNGSRLLSLHRVQVFLHRCANCVIRILAQVVKSLLKS